jgi:DNA recombination protein RmuC
MTARILESLLMSLAPLIGVAFTAGVAMVAVVRSCQARTIRYRDRLAACERQLTSERIAAAAMRADLDHLGAQIVEVKASRDEALGARDCSAHRAAELERELAAANATLAQLKLNEGDVDARLQRIAGVYVAEAREVLVRAAAERFAGDASTFRESLVASVTPLSERLDVLGKSIGELGTARTEDRARVATLLDGLHAKLSGLDEATRRVERVLGSSQARGSWGEFELKRLLELTGMTEHVSFETQESGYGTDASGRPDVVLRIPGNLTVPIDAKVPFARYQEAVSAHSEAEREPLLDQAVAAIRGHVRVLGARRYHESPACVGWTIMFVPIEAMLATLFARDHEIFEFARGSRVLIASPLTLMLYLEAFSRGWAAQKQSENATVILDEARLLVKRLTTFAERFGKVGSTLNSAIEKYNEAAASFEGRLAPQARKIVALRGDPEDVPPAVEQVARARAIDASRLPSTTIIELETGLTA